MIDVGLNVKVDQFNEAMNQMAAVLKGSTTKRDIIRSEVQSILQKTVQNVKTGNEASIRLNVMTRPWTTMNGKKYKLSNRYPDMVWSGLMSQQKAELDRRIASIGWGARAWFELASILGLSINAGKGATAIEAGKDARNYVDALTRESDDSYAIRIVNRSKLQAFIGGSTAFFSAVAGRVGFFRQNLSHGVFNDLRSVAAKYPGITISGD